MHDASEQFYKTIQEDHLWSGYHLWLVLGTDYEGTISGITHYMLVYKLQLSGYTIPFNTQ